MPATGKPILESEGKAGDPSQPIISETAPPEVKADEPLKKDHVRVRVMKAGHGKISKGTIDMSENAQERDEDGALKRIQPFPYHEKGDELVLHKRIAEGLEDRGFVEIMD